MKIYLDGRVISECGDITSKEADAIVNAANSTLYGGGGVDGAIHGKGGPGILKECREIRADRYRDGLPAGEAVSTSAGNLRAKYIIHTVGPVYNGGRNGEPQALSSAYMNSLLLAQTLGCRSIAFPAISTGVYGYPPEKAAAVVSQVISNYIKGGGNIEVIYLVFYSENSLQIFDNNQLFNK